MTQSQDNANRKFKQIARKAAQSIGWNWLPSVTEWMLDLAIEIQQIPAPTFAEKTRAEAVMNKMQHLGLVDLSLDERFNVYGRLRGTDPTLPGLMIVAHTDTVFSDDTDLSIERENGKISGPGLGDNSLGVAGILALVEGLRRASHILPRDLWIVATSREEGLGDLGGMRLAYETLKDKIDTVINVEGMAYGFVYNEGIAVRRLKITALADGGHSWVHYGRQSAVHGLVALGAKLIQMQPPSEPRTTYNIGVINGGHSVNSIATRAEMWLDMRSESSEALQNLETEVRGYIDVLRSDELRFEVELVNDRPAGKIPADHPLVQSALAVLELEGAKGSLHTGSTDGNISIAAGCPTVTIGMTTGGNAHRTDEYIETNALSKGLKQLILLTILTARGLETL